MSTNTDTDTTTQIDLTQVRRDSKGEYIIRKYTFENTQTVNGKVYRKRNHKQYRYRLKKEKSKIINNIMTKLKQLEFLDLTDIANEFDNWLKKDPRKYPDE